MTDRPSGDRARGPLPGHDSPDGAAEAPRARRFSTTRVEVEGREEVKVVELPSIELEPWPEGASLDVVGTSVPRQDSLEKITGQARYTADETRPGMLHAVLLRSPVPAGVVTLLDASAALAHPGVRAVLVVDDVRGIKVDGLQLLDHTIRYASQPLAAICADTIEAAARAAALVRIEIAPAPHVVTAEAALAADAPRVRSHGNTTKASPRISARGDVEAGLRDAEVVITREYRTPVALHTAMEPHGALAEWTGDQLTVWESTQGIFMTRSDLADAFGLPLSRVRVVKSYMGGGFGAKNGASHATYVAGALARRLGRPVRCILDRFGEQTDAGNRPSTIQRVTIGARSDGTLTAIVLDATVNLGVGGWQGGPAKIYHELYRCPNVRTSETFVFTNAGAMASFRAPGHTEGAFGLESILDALARELRMDPLELRRRNHADAHQEKKRPYSDKRLRECYDAGASRFGWDRSAASPARRDHGDGAPGSAPRLRRGRGMASVTWGAGGGPPAYATVRLNRDGSIDVLTGAQDLGTGSRTVLAQIAAEQLGADPAQVRTVLGDTERLPFAPNAWGSMTTASVGPAVRVAAEEARRVLFEAAAAMLDAAPEDLGSRGSVITHDASGRTLSFADVCEKLGDVMIAGHGSRGPNPEAAIAAFGAQFAEVEVDIDTGQVRVLRIVSAHDSGRIVNPTLAEAQLEGGIIQGLGYALFEERVMDDRLGLPLNPSMHDYKIPTMADIPRIEAFCVPAADVVANHTGVKGLAEPPIIPTAPAIANAVADAIGVEIHELPLTPWRVLAALRVAGRS